MQSTCEPATMRSEVYRLLAAAFLYPKPERANTTALAEATRTLAATAQAAQRHELARALDETAEAMDARTDAAFEREYLEVFGHAVAGDCPPYEGEYGYTDIFQKTQMLAHLNTFYHAFGITLNPEIKDRPDHAGVELDFMHVLAAKEAYAQGHGHGEDKVRLCQDAQGKFLAHHLAPWVLEFARRLERKAGASNCLSLWARLLRTHIEAELAAFHLDPTPSRRRLPVVPLNPPDEAQEAEACSEPA